MRVSVPDQPSLRFLRTAGQVGCVAFGWILGESQPQRGEGDRFLGSIPRTAGLPKRSDLIVARGRVTQRSRVVNHESDMQILATHVNPHHWNSATKVEWMNFSRRRRQHSISTSSANINRQQSTAASFISQSWRPALISCPTMTTKTKKTTSISPISKNVMMCAWKRASIPLWYVRFHQSSLIVY